MRTAFPMLFWCLLFSVVCYCAGTSQADELKVGTAKRIITPNPLLPVSGGMGPTAPATKKLGEMSTRAIVIESGKTKFAIVSIDALGFPSVLVSKVATQVKNIQPENIIVGSSHTHSGPDFYAFPDGKGGHTGDLKYIQQVCQWMAEAINEAEQKLQPAKFRSAVGDVQGQVAYNYYAVELYDPRANVQPRW
jgi:predicted neutral ceramidase superfamily lipid hydrolase